MKSFFLAAAVATIAAVNAADCELAKLAPVVASASATQCTADSTYTFLPPTSPSTAILPQICASTACQKVLADVTALGLGDCTVTVAVPPVQLDTFLASFTTACASLSGASTSTSTGSGSSAAATATVTTPAPAATTAAPASSASSSTGSSASSSTVSTPASSTPTPSTTTSASSAVTLASSAVVLAAAAAFM